MIETVPRNDLLREVLLLRRKPIVDHRGSFRRVYSTAEYSEVGINEAFVEDNVSVSKRNVLRGLHFDFRLAKFVQVLIGEVFDVVVDIRPESKTYGAWSSFELSGERGEQLLVPRGFAHGFYVTSDSAVVSYKQTAFYDPQSEGQLRWNDPELGIAWPLESAPIVSEKDAAAPLLSALRQ